MHTSRSERHERSRREQLELGDGTLVAGGAVGDLGRLLGALKRLIECLRRDRLAADQNTLSPGRDVGGHVGAGRDSVRLEQRRGHPRDRGLAVGADDVDRGDAVLRHPEQQAEPPHPLQAELPAENLAAEQDLFGGARYPPSSSSSARLAASFSRSASTTSAGALATNPSLESLASPLLTSARSFSRRSSMRAPTAAGSTPSVSSSSTPPTLAIGSPPSSENSTRASLETSSCGRVSSARAVRTCLTGTPARSRQRRSARVSVIAWPISASAVSSMSDSSTCGNGWMTRASAGFLG